MFQEKVKKFIRTEQSGDIDYNEQTYEELIQEINQVGINFCNDLKLKEQLKNQRRNTRQELGNFGYQFGFENPPYLKRKT